jgi:hypothetical protein
MHEWMQNRMTYVDRMRALAGMTDPKSVNTLLGDTDAWAELVGRARNGLAHASGRRAIDLVLLFRLLVVTRALSALVLAERLGVDADTQFRFVTTPQVQYHSIEFKRLTAPESVEAEAGS